jgi:hypothetical protein
VDEVGQPGGAQPGTYKDQSAGAAKAGGSSVVAATGSNPPESVQDRPVDGFDADTVVPISPSWQAAPIAQQTAPIAEPIDATTDHALLLASLRVTRASIARNAIGHHMSDALLEDTVESLTVPGGIGRDTAAMRPNRADQEESVRYMTRPVTTQPDLRRSQPELRLPSPRLPDAAEFHHPREAGLGGDHDEPAEPAIDPLTSPLSDLGVEVPAVAPVIDQPAARNSEQPLPPELPAADPSPAERGPDSAERRPNPPDQTDQGPDQTARGPAAAESEPDTAGRGADKPDHQDDVRAERVLEDELPPPQVIATLPIRVPAAPDVPDVPDDDEDYDGPEAEAAAPENPELTRIASRLRHDEVPSAPPADLDVGAVLEAVRGVPGVANAHLRGNPGGMHTLRLDLADGADPGRVSRQVARLLKERMGLAAEPRRSRTSGSAPLVEERPVAPEPVPTISQPAVSQPVRPVPPQADEPPLFPRPRPSTLSDVAAGDGRLPDPPPRVVVDQVRVSTLGSEATVEVRLATGGVPSIGAATGPAVDGYLLRLAAQAAASAIDGLVEAAPTAPQVRCFIDHAGVVPFGSCVVAVVVVLVSGAGWVEQLVGSAIVAGDPRQAIVRATLAAMNRRLESLLA